MIDNPKPSIESIASDVFQDTTPQTLVVVGNLLEICQRSLRLGFSCEGALFAQQVNFRDQYSADVGEKLFRLCWDLALLESRNIVDQ